MKSINRIILLLASGCVAGCSLKLKNDDLLSPSALNGNADFYNGKIVLLKGYLILMPESHDIYESKDLDEYATRRFNSGDKTFNVLSFEWKRYCLTIANPDFIYRHRSFFNHKTVVIKGKFMSNYLNSRKLDLGACVLPTAIIIDYSDLKRRYPSIFSSQ